MNQDFCNEVIRRLKRIEPNSNGWTKKIPKTEGWYWVKSLWEMGYNISIVMVRINSSGAYNGHSEETLDREYFDDGYEFAGPLCPPE